MIEPRLTEENNRRRATSMLMMGGGAAPVCVQGAPATVLGCHGAPGTGLFFEAWVQRNPSWPRKVGHGWPKRKSIKLQSAPETREGPTVIGARRMLPLGAALILALTSFVGWILLTPLDLHGPEFEIGWGLICRAWG